MLVKINETHYVNDNDIEEIRVYRESDSKFVKPSADFYTLEIKFKDNVAPCFHKVVNFNYKTIKQVNKKFKDLFSLYK